MQRWLEVLRQGLRRALQLRLLVPIYFGSLLLGLFQTWPMAAGATRGALQNGLLQDLVTGGVNALTDFAIADPSVTIFASLWVLALLGVTLVMGLLYNFFSGGVLHAYAGKLPFWAGCRRTFWSYTGLGALLLLVAVFVIVIATLLQGLLGFTGSVAVALVLLQLLNLGGEYARALAVTRDRLNPFVLLGMAANFCVRRLPGVLLLAVLGLLLHVALGALYTPVANLFGASPLVVLWQQLLVFAWIWVKFLRLAWAIVYTEPRQLPQLPQPVEEIHLGTLPA